MSIQSYRDLKVWQRAVDLVELCYQATRLFPVEERYGLVSQIRRAVVSIATNIAEGQGRSHTKEFLNHLSMARGSLMEVETLLLISQRVGMLSSDQLSGLAAVCDEVSRMLTGLRRSLEGKVAE